MTGQDRHCSVRDCVKRVKALGMCNMHWERNHRHGSVDLPGGRREGITKGRIPIPVEERFWAKVDRSGDCWTWTAMRNEAGYGVLNIHVDGVGLRPVIASRLAYELAHGPIPSGNVVRHKCDNPPCVRASHLELGTQIDNMRDMRERGRTATGERHSQAKLTWQSVAEIRVLLLAGESHRSIGHRFGVSASAIDSIASGRTWKEQANV